MTSEVVIDVQQKDISIALMEDKQLVEYQNEPREHRSLWETSTSQRLRNSCRDLTHAS